MPLRPRPCAYCGEPFRPTDKRGRHCSYRCKNLAAGHNPRDRQCERCGLIYHACHSKQRYCSHSCAASVRNEPYRKIPRNCIACGLSFIYRKQTQQTCSKSCSQRMVRAVKPNIPVLSKVSAQGYQVIRLNGKAFLEHRYVMEQHLGRPLQANELVHHLDGNKLNNRITNLALTDRSAHPKMHCPTFRSDTEKECCKCHLVKFRDEFYPKPAPGRDPHRTRCKACEAQETAERRRKQ